MKQIRSITALILASIMALAMFGGCAGDNPEAPTPSPDTEIPASEEPTEVPTEEPTEVPTEEPTPEPEGETYEVHGVEADFNFEYFDDTGDEELFAFSAAVPLPVGWELRDEPTEDCFPFRNLAYPNNDRKCIYDAEGNCVGVVAGFGYEPSGYEEQKYYPATFGHISYVALDEGCVSAECDPSCLSTISVCFYDMQQWCEPEYEITEPEVYNPTIIVENLETHCYISIEFLHGLLSTETITEIAESAVVYSYGDPSKSERKTYEVRGVEADFNFEYLSADERLRSRQQYPCPLAGSLGTNPRKTASRSGHCFPSRIGLIMTTNAYTMPRVTSLALLPDMLASWPRTTRCLITLWQGIPMRHLEILHALRSMRNACPPNVIHPVSIRFPSPTMGRRCSRRRTQHQNLRYATRQ